MNSLKAVLAALAAFSAIAGAASAHAETVKIGVVQTTTGGSAALYGIEQKNAIELVIAKANQSGELGPLKLEVVHYDDGADRGQTVNIFQRLISRDNVSAILGPTLTTSAYAADPIAQKAGLPVIASSNTAPGLTKIGDYIFRVSPPESLVTPQVIDAVLKRHPIKRVAQIYGIDDQLTKAAYAVQKQALEERKLEIVATETFQKGDVDFAAQLTKIKAANPDLIVLGALAEESASIIRQARQLGIPDSVVFIGTQSSISTKFFELGGESAQGLVVGTAWYSGSSVPESRAFVEQYRQTYANRHPDIYSAYGHDAASLLVEAIKRAGSGDRKAIRDQLAKIDGYPGVLGPIGFDEQREPTVKPSVLVARNGQFVPYE